MVFLSSRIPAAHPSSAILGEERMGAGVAVGDHRVLTAHYLVLGAASVEVVGADGRTREVEHVALDHESGFALLFLKGPGDSLGFQVLRDSAIREIEVVAGNRYEFYR